jgi:hypothetical protein
MYQNNDTFENYIKMELYMRAKKPKEFYPKNVSGKLAEFSMYFCPFSNFQEGIFLSINSV